MATLLFPLIALVGAAELLLRIVIATERKGQRKKQKKKPKLREARTLTTESKFL